MRKQVDSVLHEFGDFLGIEDLAFDADHRCVLAFDECVISLTWREPLGTLLIYSEVGFLDNPDTSLLIELLTANYPLPESSAGGVIGLVRDNERHGFAVASTREIQVASLDLRALIEIITKFVGLSESWQKRLASGALAVRGQQSNHIEAPAHGFERV